MSFQVKINRDSITSSISIHHYCRNRSQKESNANPTRSLTTPETKLMRICRCQNTWQTTIWKNMGGPRETCTSLSWCWWKGESSLEEVYNLYFHCVLHAISCKIISKESPNQGSREFQKFINWHPLPTHL